MGKDYYKTLDIGKGASQDEIKKAFRKKAHQFHPDKSTGDEAKFKEINEAYQVLGDAKKRAQYDQFGSSFESAQGQGGFSGFDGFRDFSGSANGFNINMDDLGDMFGGFGDIFGFGSRSNQRARGHSKGADMQTSVSVSFMEAVFGTEKELNFRKKIQCDRCHGHQAEPGSKIETCKVCGGAGRVTRVQRTILGNMQVQAECDDCGGEGKTYDKKCSKCGGSGTFMDSVKLKIKIPAGINDGETIRLSGQGEAGEKGTPAGDLYLKIKVSPDKRFIRDGYDIRTTSQIGFADAALGGSLDVLTVDGIVKLKIPDGTQSETVFKLRGKGITRLNGGGRGDHFVKVSVKTPTGLNRKQRELLKELNA